jgi:hypothetical protein
METLVVAQHRNQYYSQSKSSGPVQFGSSPSRDFGGINCRSYQSGAGILPTPLKACSTSVTKQCFYSPSSSLPDTPSPTHSDSKTHSKTTVKSAPININLKACRKERAFSEDVANERLSFSELWAGPTYSNSPPPSSLPIPKFSLRPKRTASLDLPLSVPEMIKTHHPMAKSAPPSPTREHQSSTRDIFRTADSATKTLRRILNLDE